MNSSRFFLSTTTRRIMRTRARRVFVRQLIGGVVFTATLFVSVAYFWG